MSRLQPIREGKSIVLVGNFNPDIFHPAWFASEGLVRRSEAEQAEVSLVHPDFSQVKFDGFFLRITRDRFQLSTEQRPYYPVIRDLALGTFRILEHTPVKAVGINSDAHFTLPNREVWDAFGHRLAPKEVFWSPVLDRPGMRSLTVEGLREGSRGYVRVRVQPAPGMDATVYLDVNDHYDVETDEPAGARSATEVLDQEWDSSESRTQTIFRHLMTEAVRGVQG